MRVALSLAALALVAQSAQAQTPTSLTLDEAIALARHNNPLFQQTVNARRSADAQVRTAYASLLPSVSANLAGRYQQTGQQFVQGIALNSSSDIVQSSYGLGVNYTINSDILFAPRVFRANRDAAEADVTGATEVLRSTVTQQYLTVLQAGARGALQDTLIQTTRGLLELAKARQAVGAATILDVRRAEVALGQAEVAALQAHNTAEIEKLRLYQQLGVPQPDTVALTTKFDIAPVTFNVDSLVNIARTQNPTLVAVKLRERAAGVSVSGARGRYLPTLSLNTGWGGNSSAFTNESALLKQRTQSFESQRAGCFFEDSLRSAVSGMTRLNCNAFTFTAQDSAGIIAQNNKFPWKFERAPMSFSAFISMPIFDNLQREQRLQEAIIQRDNARYSVRARELQLTADVTQAYLNLQTAIKTTQLQEVNAARAREELSFAEERYRVGAATFLDVTTSRGTFEQAQIDRLNAIYDYHRAFAALESAVGRPLR
jgi:outer membrane protein